MILKIISFYQCSIANDYSTSHCYGREEKEDHLHHSRPLEEGKQWFQNETRYILQVHYKDIAEGVYVL